MAVVVALIGCSEYMFASTRRRCWHEGRAVHVMRAEHDDRELGCVRSAVRRRTDYSKSHLRFRKKLIERLTSFNEALVEHEVQVEFRQAADQIEL